MTALEAPVNESAKLEAELRHGDPDERLRIFLEGWFRGIAGALEELAVELDRQAGG